MGMPTDIGVIDLMLGIPDPGKKEGWYDFQKPNLCDAESATFKFPAQYMFKEVPEDPTEGDMVEYTIDQLNKHGIEKAGKSYGWNSKDDLKEVAAKLKTANESKAKKSKKDETEEPEGKKEKKKNKKKKG